MPEPQRRFDSYGRPLPILADVQTQSLLDREANLAARRFLLYLLEQTYRDVLRRGVHAEVTLRFLVVDGMMQDQVWLGTQRKHGGGQDWRKREEER